MKGKKADDVEREKLRVEARRWKKVNQHPEGYFTNGGYGIVLANEKWTLYFVKNRMREIDDIEASGSLPPFCWARQIIDGIQEKRNIGGWSEKPIRGKPGTELDKVKVPKDLLKSK